MSYNLYKPLRNYLRQLTFLECLGTLRSYIQYFAFSTPLPSGIGTPPQFYSRIPIIFGWQLELLAKEVILNCPDHGKGDFRSWNILADALNKLRNLENETAKSYPRDYNALQEIFRIAHRQFPWQHPQRASTALNRYFRIFSTPDLSALIAQKTGLDIYRLYSLGLALTGFFMDGFAIRLPLRSEIPDVDDDVSNKFLARFSMDLDTARKKIAEAQSYDQDFAYALNPLKISPLLQIDRGDHSALCAPVPPYLLQRFTEGIYYEIYDLPGFAAAFGTSFQNHVGQVVSVACQGGSLTLLPEQSYIESKNKKDSVDWIASDKTGDLFIECKTKRLTFAAKMALASTNELHSELDKMAGFVVQIYKTLTHAKAGHYPHWKQRDLPVYPIIVTLEEWYAFGDFILKAIDERVKERLAQNGLSPALMTEHPYVIASAANFEICMQVIDKHGIQGVLAALTSGEKRYWLMDTVLSDEFRDTYKQTRELFPDTLDALTARHKPG